MRFSFIRTLQVAALALLTWSSALVAVPAQSTPQPLVPPARDPVRLIFDTDIGNDVDDALALGVIHALQSRRECRLLGVTITKDHDDAARLVDAIDTFYGRGNIPIGVCRSGVTPEQGSFLPLAQVRDGDELRYPRDVEDVSQLPDAVTLLRRLLSESPDGSVTIAQVGFSTNLAKLLDSPADDLGPAGPELVAQKVKLLSLMFGAFAPIDGGEHREYNVVMDLPASQRLVERWPTEMIFSGFEIGLTITYPAQSILEDFGYVPHHPLAEAYQLYMPTPHERPNWDLTSVLYAVRPTRDYFSLSEPGTVTVDENGVTRHVADPAGKHRYLIVDDRQRAQVRESLAVLASQPPDARRRNRGQGAAVRQAPRRDGGELP